MKPTKPPTKPSLQMKSGTKPPVRTSVNNSSLKNRDISPEHVPTAFLKMKNAKEIQNTSNSGLFSNTPTKRSPSRLNSSSITDDNKSPLEILTNRKSTTHKRNFTIYHIYTYEIPKIDDEYTNEYNTELFNMLLSEKDQEIRSLKAQVHDLTTISYPSPNNYNNTPNGNTLAFESHIRPTELDNTIFAFEEERVRLETRCVDLTRELEVNKQDLADCLEEKGKVSKELFELRRRLDVNIQAFLEMENTVDDLKAQLSNNEVIVDKARTAISAVESSLNNLYDITGCKPYVNEEANGLVEHIELIVSSIRGSTELLKAKKLHVDHESTTTIEGNCVYDTVNPFKESVKYESGRYGDCYGDEWVSVDEFNEAVSELADLRLKVHKITSYLVQSGGFMPDEPYVDQEVVYDDNQVVLNSDEYLN